MNITSTIVTTTDGHSLSLYDICRQLSKRQRKQVLERLRQKGIDIEKIEAYEYPEVREIKHLFIRFKGAAEDTPYFLLSEEIFTTIADCIAEEYSSSRPAKIGNK